MATFGITPVTGFPPASSESFPDFIQFQSDGVDLGSPDVDTVDFIGATATRGTGENSNKVTVRAAPNIVWRETGADTVLGVADAGNGIALVGNTGVQVVTVPADTGDVLVDLPDGCCVLVFHEGAGNVSFTASSGVALVWRAEFLAATAGQYAPVSLIKRAANSWFLCGDLASAA